MPQIQFTASLAAGAVADPLANWQYRYSPFAGTLRVWIQEICAHASLGCHLLATITSGSDTLMQESPVGIRDDTSLETGIIPRPLDIIPVVDQVAAGDVIKVSIRNTDVGTRVYAGVVELIPN